MNVMTTIYQSLLGLPPKKMVQSTARDGSMRSTPDVERSGDTSNAPNEAENQAHRVEKAKSFAEQLALLRNGHGNQGKIG